MPEVTQLGAGPVALRGLDQGTATLLGWWSSTRGRDLPSQPQWEPLTLTLIP